MIIINNDNNTTNNSNNRIMLGGGALPPVHPLLAAWNLLAGGECNNFGRGGAAPPAPREGDIPA